MHAVARRGATWHLWLWALVLIATPFYVIRSGLPQPVDFLAVGLAGSVLLTRLRVVGTAVRPLQLLLFTLWYILCVNMFWTFATQSTSFLVYSSYYLYNAALFIALVAMYGRHGPRVLEIVVAGLVVSVLLQTVLAVALLPVGARRHVLFFNNPNQLGYYALVAAAFILVASEVVRVHALVRASVLVGALFLAVLSGSKAAVGAMGLLWVVAALQKPMLAVGSAIVVGGLLLAWNPDWTPLLLLHEPDLGLSFAEERAYDRIVNHPEHTLLGAGEGEFSRFRAVRSSHEIHSTFGTLLFSYGIIGLLSFGFFCWAVVRRVPLTIVMYTAGVFVYGIAHQGLRSRMLWLFLAFVLCVAAELARQGRRGNPATPGRRRGSAWTAFKVGSRAGMNELRDQPT